MRLQKHFGSVVWCKFTTYYLISIEISYFMLEWEKINFYAMFQNISQGLMMYQLDFEAQ